MPKSKTSRYRKETMFVSHLVVWSADIYGLIDMMRYDNCYPALESEAAKVQAIARHDRTINGRPKTPLDHCIKLVRVSRVTDGPSVNRWRSFNARVLWYMSPEHAWPTDDELQALLEGIALQHMKGLDQ